MGASSRVSRRAWRICAPFWMPLDRPALWSSQPKRDAGWRAFFAFTDIVGSTERAMALGDLAWRDLLARHHARIRRELDRFRGKERDTAGDGFFATFDGPARAIRAAQAIVGGVKELGLETRI